MLVGFYNVHHCNFAYSCLTYQSHEKHAIRMKSHDIWITKYYIYIYKILFHFLWWSTQNCLVRIVARVLDNMVIFFLLKKIIIKEMCNGRNWRRPKYIFISIIISLLVENIFSYCHFYVIQGWGYLGCLILLAFVSYYIFFILHLIFCK